jgi:uncharacterized protein
MPVAAGPKRLSGCAGTARRLYSLNFPVIIDDVGGFALRAGGAQRRFTYGCGPLDAESNGRLAGRKHGFVKAIADGDSAQGIKGLDPIVTGQLTREEIADAEAHPEQRLHIADPKVRLPEAKQKKGPRYTPVSRRQDRPNAILWLVRNHPELKDSQIMRLVGTTKSTIQSIRDRSHWNSASLTPLDPVTLGLSSQIDLDLEVQRAAKEKPAPVEAQGATLLPASVTTAPKDEPEASETPSKKSEDLDVEAVFAKLKRIGGTKSE